MTYRLDFFKVHSHIPHRVSLGMPLWNISWRQWWHELEYHNQYRHLQDFALFRCEYKFVPEFHYFYHHWADQSYFGISNDIILIIVQHTAWFADRLWCWVPEAGIPDTHTNSVITLLMNKNIKNNFWIVFMQTGNWGRHSIERFKIKLLVFCINNKYHR